MRPRMALLVIMLVPVLVGSGCSTTSSQVSIADMKIQEMEHQIGGLQNTLATLQVSVRPEPDGDVSLFDATGGTYMALIDRMSTDTSPSVAVIDFVTDGVAPWASKKDRQRSSWRNLYGWNASKHPQSFPLSQQATLVVFDPAESRNGPGLIVVSKREFADRLKAEPERKKLRYYVSFGGREITNIWPVPLW